MHVNKSEMINPESEMENQDLIAGRKKLTNGLMNLTGIY